MGENWLLLKALETQTEGEMWLPCLRASLQYSWQAQSTRLGCESLEEGTAALPSAPSGLLGHLHVLRSTGGWATRSPASGGCTSWDGCSRSALPKHVAGSSAEHLVCKQWWALGWRRLSVWWAADTDTSWYIPWVSFLLFYQLLFSLYVTPRPASFMDLNSTYFSCQITIFSLILCP